MVNKVKPKQSITANAVPESLERGELAINVTDRKLYSSDGNTVFELTGGSSNGGGGSGNANPGGSNTSIQFNDSGSLGGNASFTYNKTTNTISVGNSTVNATINSTFFSQTANNALTANVANSSLFANYSYFANVANTVSNITNTQIIVALGYVPAVSANGLGYVPVNKAGDSMTGQLNVGSNVQLTLSSLIIGNSTINTTVNSSMFRIGTANVWTTASLTNVSQLSNDAGYITNVNTSLGYTPANRAGDTFTGEVAVNKSFDGANLATMALRTLGSYGGGITFQDTGYMGMYVYSSGQEFQIAFSNTTSANIATNGLYINSLGFIRPQTALIVGSNVSLNTSTLRIGNSTVNTVVNATGISILGTGGSLGVGTTQSGTTGEIRATGNITAYFSDMRLKKDIVVIPEAIEKIKNISGVYYRTNDIAKSYGYQDDKTLQVGVLAQEIQKQFPELVQIAPFDSDFSDGTLKSKSGENYLTVNMLGLIPVLIESIKKLSDKVDNLENELNKYKNNTN